MLRPPDSELSDSEYLQQLGVEPRFKRALGFFTGSLFAVAFQGPTTGALLITGATLAIGGPAFIWAIPIIFVLQMLLAVTWAELSSHYPLTGGIYQWARRLGGRFHRLDDGAVLRGRDHPGHARRRVHVMNIVLVGPVHQHHGDAERMR